MFGTRMPPAATSTHPVKMAVHELTIGIGWRCAEPSRPEPRAQGLMRGSTGGRPCRSVSVGQSLSVRLGLRGGNPEHWVGVALESSDFRPHVMAWGNRMCWVLNLHTGEVRLAGHNRTGDHHEASTRIKIAKLHTDASPDIVVTVDGAAGRLTIDVHQPHSEGQLSPPLLAALFTCDSLPKGGRYSVVASHGPSGLSSVTNVTKMILGGGGGGSGGGDGTTNGRRPAAETTVGAAAWTSQLARTGSADGATQGTAATVATATPFPTGSAHADVRLRPATFSPSSPAVAPAPAATASGGLGASSPASVPPTATADSRPKSVSAADNAFAAAVGSTARAAATNTAALDASTAASDALDSEAAALSTAVAAVKALDVSPDGLEDAGRRSSTMGLLLTALDDDDVHVRHQALCSAAEAVRQRRNHFGPFLPHFSAPPPPPVRQHRHHFGTIHPHFSAPSPRHAM